jgi:hypothetical protein
MRHIMMPPTPEQSQASALASAGMERAPPTSLAMSLSATAVIQAAPNAIVMMQSATLATTQDDRVSIEEEEDCNIKAGSGRSPLLQTGLDLTTHAGVGAARRIALRNARPPATRKILGLFRRFGPGYTPNG